jgi:hypothetical protein
MLDIGTRSPEEVAMIRSGVGRVYLKRSLSEWAPESQPVIDMVQDAEWKTLLTQKGIGAVLHGEPHFADQMVHMTARSAMIRGVNCVLADLPDLHRAMVREEVSEETMDRFERAAVILIPSFCSCGYSQHPMSRGEVFGLERVLTTFLDEGRALVLGTSAPMITWWSKGLTQYIQRRTTRIELA